MPTRTFEFEGLRAVVEDQGYHPELSQYVFYVSVEAPTGEAHKGHIITGGALRRGPEGTIGRPWKEDYAYAAFQAMGLMRVLLDLGVEKNFRKTIRNYGIYDRAQQKKTRAKMEDSWEVSQVIGPQALDAALFELETLAKMPPGSAQHMLEQERKTEPGRPIRFNRKTFKAGYDFPLPPGMEQLQEAVQAVKAGEMDWDQFRALLHKEIVYMEFVHPSQVEETVDQVMAQIESAVEAIEEAEEEGEPGSEMSGPGLSGLEELPGWEELDLFMV